MSVNLFDVNFYRAANPDLASAGLVTDVQLTNHFQEFGINEPRRFSAVVDLNFYRANNPDLARGGVTTNRALYDHLSNFGVGEGRAFSTYFGTNSYGFFNPDLSQYANATFTSNNDRNEFYFNHFNSFGLAESRQFSQFIDLSFYKLRNADLASLNNTQLLYHLQLSGLNERRVFSPLVDMSFYLTANQDLNSVFNNNIEGALQHLQQFGINEQRRFSSFVDLSVYQAANPDLRVALPSYRGLFDHLTFNGINEGRRFSLSYDTSFYRSSNSDLAALSNAQLLQHFQIYGLSDGENRTSSDIFNATAYLAENQDLQAAGLNKRAAQQHFELFGYRESRRTGALSFPQFNNSGNTFATSSNIGAISSQRGGSIEDRLTPANPEDMYKILVPFTQTVNFSVTGFSGNLGVQLAYDLNGDGVYNNSLTGGERIGSFSSSTTPSQVTFNRTLGAGTYYILLTGTGGFNSAYNLNLSASNFNLTPNVDIGDTLGTALNIGTITNTQTVQQFVGTTDPVDVYRFNVRTTSNVALNLSGLTGLSGDTVDFELISDRNNNGQIDRPSDIIVAQKTATSSSINRSLTPGTYFVRVARSQPNGNTGYSLSFATT